MFAVHPLTVEAQIDVSDEKDDEVNQINLAFSHLSNLDVLTVKVGLEFNKESKNMGAADREVMKSSTLFSHLLSGLET